jgi:hypothetical protein
MTLDVLFRSIGSNIRRIDHPDLPTDTDLLPSLQASDSSDALITGAGTFLEGIYGDAEKGRSSRAQTPMVTSVARAQTPLLVGRSSQDIPGSFPSSPPSARRPPLVVYPSLRSSSQCSMNSHRSSVRTSTRQLSTISEQASPQKFPKSPSRPPPWHRPSFLTKNYAKTTLLKDSAATHQAARRNPPPRPSALPSTPDVSAYAVDVTPDTDFVVLVSMYEVYNDRIFDLLTHPAASNAAPMTTRAGAALQKGLMRRPLLFKNTEMSPDRKVVAGLRKIVCGSYEEAMMVLETGLVERRVAGTGSNSVSSRSHGFFCIEVKQKDRHACYETAWNGGTLSIVDLAGSERARNAKTTGSTLAEAGKINESLMYLGQCLQVQSDCQQDGSRPIVPFRQCKLTELLFSNSFPSKESTYRTPQKAIMIVTADPQGDFNATSQILRYSALAREVTVPRVPSVTSTILSRPGGPGGRLTPNGGTRYDNQYTAEELEQAANEIARLSEEADLLSVRLAEEEIRRTEVELRLRAAEEKAEAMEAEVREECWSEMEARIEEERERWRKAKEEERVRSEAYLDGKIGILEKSASGTFEIHEDVQARVEEVERENQTLRARLQAFEREMQQRSPTKAKSPRKRVTQAPSKLSESFTTALTEASDTNVMTNPFLASLRPKKSSLLNRSQSPTGSDVDVAAVSPRKLSLRPNSGRKMDVDVAEEDFVDENEGLQQVPKTPATVIRKKLTGRKWDLGDPERLFG